MAQYKGPASEGGRAMQMLKRREKAQEEVEFKKKKIEEDLKVSRMENKFAAHYDAIEQRLKSETIGLVTLDEMRAKQEVIVKEREKEMVKLEKERLAKEKALQDKISQEKQKQKKKIQSLSFNPDEDGDESEELLSESENNKFKKIGKNPDVDTSFLPDRDREEEENRLREELRQEWSAKQESLKQEPIEITYSYWDGSGHRRVANLKKGNSVYQFLQKCLRELRTDFSELKTVTADQLMYVKEDLIIPHHYSFYDFIVTKARGKSGPLFSFDVHDDVRLLADSKREKDESHAGKVLLRSWYERNKHIFPASRWEPYDPTKDYGLYTIKDTSKK
ncbi:protein FAM50 homolog [Artemia franciscana]|uniref:Protein FAM50 homolog n=1 Tax=Artemia franciscana TaxID=6661 RepID=A0AA88L5T5_ARTSF|nr:hypothetical protein QYM36_014597 [Artemia franciscana]KAK2709020.1 hypothetical protein QYM36_014597 [Artemia franciscana]